MTKKWEKINGQKLIHSPSSPRLIGLGLRIIIAHIIVCESTVMPIGQTQTRVRLSQFDPPAHGFVGEFGSQRAPTDAGS